jgi:hypothetical protein
MTPRRAFAYASLILAGLGCAQAGPPGPPGDTGRDGLDGEPEPDRVASPGLVYPDHVLCGREHDVAITFHATELDDEVSIDLGPGIDVLERTVVSPTTLYARIAVMDEAAHGPRDVAVDVGGATLRFDDGLDVGAAVALAPSTEQPGSMTQGRFAFVEAVNLDPESEFDCGALGSFFVYPQVYFSSPHVWTFSAGRLCAPDHMTAPVLWAPLTPDEPRLDVVNGAVASPWQRFVGHPLPVAAQAPIELTAGVPLEGQNLAQPFASNLYQLATTAPAIVELRVESTSSVWPTLLSFGPGGSFDDLLDWPWPANSGTRAIYPVTAARNHQAYFIYFDGYQRGGAAEVFGYRLVPEVTPVGRDRQLVEAEPNDSPIEATVVDPSLPFLLEGTFSDSADHDVVALALEAGERVTVVIEADEPFHWKMNGMEGDRSTSLATVRVTFTAAFAGEHLVALAPRSGVAAPFDYVVTALVEDP